MQSWMRPRQAETLPVRLQRNRIYVLPTMTGLFFGLLLGTMGLGALNFNNNPALLLALLLAGAAQASLIAAHMQLSGVVIDTVAADPVPAGEPLRLRIAARPPFGYLAPAEPERLGLRVAHPPLRPPGRRPRPKGGLGCAPPGPAQTQGTEREETKWSCKSCETRSTG